MQGIVERERAICMLANEINGPYEHTSECTTTISYSDGCRGTRKWVSVAKLHRVRMVCMHNYMFGVRSSMNHLHSLLLYSLAALCHAVTTCLLSPYSLEDSQSKQKRYRSGPHDYNYIPAPFLLSCSFCPSLKLWLVWLWFCISRCVHASMNSSDLDAAML